MRYVNRERVFLSAVWAVLVLLERAIAWRIDAAIILCARRLAKDGTLS